MGVGVGGGDYRLTAPVGVKVSPWCGVEGTCTVAYLSNRIPTGKHLERAQDWVKEVGGGLSLLFSEDFLLLLSTTTITAATATTTTTSTSWSVVD